MNIVLASGKAKLPVCRIIPTFHRQIYDEFMLSTKEFLLFPLLSEVFADKKNPGRYEVIGALTALVGVFNVVYSVLKA